MLLTSSNVLVVGEQGDRVFTVGMEMEDIGRMKLNEHTTIAFVFYFRWVTWYA
jgi:hypothetical protein